MTIRCSIYAFQKFDLPDTLKMAFKIIACGNSHVQVGTAREFETLQTI